MPASSDTLVIEWAPYGTDAETGKAFPPHPTQARIREWVQRVRGGLHKTDGIPVLYLQHGVASGGTRAVLAPVMECVFEYPGIRVLVGRKDYQDLRMSIMETFFEIMPRPLIADRNEQEHRYTIRGPSGEGQVFFRELKDVRGLGSQEFAIIVVAEAHEIEEAAYRTLKQRCRQSCYPLMILMEGNPPPMGHWLDKLCDPSHPQHDPDIERVILTSYENWAHMAPAYRTSLEQQPEGWRRRYLMGETSALPSGTPVYPSFIDSVHVAPVQVIPGRPLIRGWDWGLRRAACYDSKTEVLTELGWKLFKDVKIGESVATLHPSTREIEYQPVQATISYPFTGNMYHWLDNGNTGYDIRVTDNHMMVVEKLDKRTKKRELSFMTARQLSEYQMSKSRRTWFIRQGKWSGSAMDCVRLPERISHVNGGTKTRQAVLWPLDNYAEFMGLYLSEGYSTLSKAYSTDVKPTHYLTTICQKIEEPVMTAVLEKTPFKFHRMKQSQQGWRAASAQLYDHLKPFGYAQDKYVPACIKTAPLEIIQKFLSMYEMGDGSESGDWVKITTTSEQMAGDLQELYLKCGYSARVSEYHSDRYTQGAAYTVSRLKTYAMRVQPNKLKVESVKNEPVYCLTVPNHTLYVRRNGRPMWSGNCVWGQLTDEGRFLIHREWMPMETPEEQFIDGVIMRTNAWFGPLTSRDFGDPAATHRDPHGVSTLQRLQAKGIHLGYRTSTYGERIPLINSKLSQMIGGKPLIQIDPRCEILIEGLMGGYHYPELKMDAEFSPKMDSPKKEGYFEHLCNAFEYACVNLWLPGKAATSTFIQKRNAKLTRTQAMVGSAYF